MTDIKLPPLPAADSHCTHRDDHVYDVWSAEQMKAYAREAIALNLSEPPLTSTPADRHEKDIADLISQRDHRDEIIDALCEAVLGEDRPEWSSAYYFEDAVCDVQEHMYALEQQATRSAEPPLTGVGEPVAIPDASELLVMAVEDGVIRLSQCMDADLQGALAKFARRFAPSPPLSAQPAEPTIDTTAVYARIAVDQMLDLLIASGNITREKGFQCRDIWEQFFVDAQPQPPQQEQS